VSFVGAVLAAVLIRRRDFVTADPAERVAVAAH